MVSLVQVVTVLGAVVATSGNLVKETPEKNFELLILHNNDMHARFEQTSQLSGTCKIADREAGKCYGGFPRVAHVVKEARKAAAEGRGPPVLYLNAGDTYTGTAWFTIYKWKIAVEFLNALHPDAVSLGNHEFDNGVSGLSPFIENLLCPVLSANLNLTKVPELQKEMNLKKSIILEIAGKKIAIVGYLTPKTKVVAKPNDVEYIDEIVALKEEVKNLQNQDIKIIIALGHSGYLKDLEIAKEVDGIDLVIGGHTNTFLWNGTRPDSEHIDGVYPTYVTQPSGRRVPVVQAYAYTKYLGKLHIIFDQNGEIISADGNPILLDKTIKQDDDVMQIIKKYQADILNISEQTVGSTSVLLDGLSCTLNECNFGNLITDAVVYRYASEYKGEHWTDVPIAIVQGGGIRSSIVHAEMRTNITNGDLLVALPFEGTLTVITMNGTVLLQALEHSVARYNPLAQSGEFLQFSGIKVIYNLRNPVGFRVVKAEARCWACDIPTFSAIEHKEIYSILASDFLSQGGDGYSMFQGLPLKILDYNERSSLQYYISQRSPVYPQVEGRITLLNEVEKSSATLSKPLTVILISVSLCICLI